MKNFEELIYRTEVKDDFFNSSPQLVDPSTTYNLTYPEFLKYFNNIDVITKHHMIIGINFIYGWMPTILDFRSENLDQGVSLLNKAKSKLPLKKEEIEMLVNLFNKSLVGTSKLLHFINPKAYTMWDSNVYKYLTGQKPYHSRLSKVEHYLVYLKFSQELVKDPRFRKFDEKINEKFYPKLLPLRIVEMVMYLKGRQAKF